MPETDRLNTLLQDVLATIVARWPGDAEPLPALQYVANGAVPWDGCETLAVSWVRSFGAPDGDPTIEQMTTSPLLVAMRAAVIDIYLLRCVPDMQINGTEVVMPAPADVEASALVILSDAQALENCVLAGDLPGCGALALESGSAAGPEGGMGGSFLRIRVSLR